MIPLPSPPKIIKEENNKAEFAIEGLYPGYGITFGNVLRRILLSSLSGAAITEVKIKDVSHEFSALSGVAEDVIMILLNLKKVRFQMFVEGPQEASLSVKGAKEIKAKDFKVSSQVKIINPEQVIATVTKPTSAFSMDIVIEQGIGYQPIEKRKNDNTKVGFLLLDAIFSPVKRVAVKIETMRVGDRTDFERLLLDVETDGTMLPKDAVKSALNILKSHLDVFDKFFDEEDKAEKKGKAAKPSKKLKSAKAKTLKKPAKTKKTGKSKKTLTKKK